MNDTCYSNNICPTNTTVVEISPTCASILSTCSILIGPAVALILVPYFLVNFVHGFIGLFSTPRLNFATISLGKDFFGSLSKICNGNSSRFIELKNLPIFGFIAPISEITVAYLITDICGYVDNIDRATYAAAFIDFVHHGYKGIALSVEIFRTYLPSTIHNPLSTLLFAWVLILFLLACILIWFLCHSFFPGFFTQKIRLEEARNLVVITGCDTGFGYMAALKLSKAGFKVMGICLTDAGAQQLRAQGIDEVVVCDVTKEADVIAMSENCHHVLATGNLKLWAVINNAGIAPVGYADWMTTESFVKVMDVNYIGVIRVIKALLPMLKVSRDSRIINMSSLAGLLAGEYMSGYCASKHALEGFAKSLRIEVKAWNIHVCNINPGFTRTPMIENSIKTAYEDFLRAPQDIQLQYNMAAMEQNMETVRLAQLLPNGVVTKVVDCVYAAHPKFNNICLGYFGPLLRVFMMLPQSWQEELVSLASVKSAPRREVIEAMQRIVK